ncbi:MAG: fasciclin domain-containing protein [Methanothrix sp.]|jgi:uncharacterized surface protein with fasciclin (FAS1) repeats|nr:fasciclin domain-containing protein [Methanothrix sp.]
MKKALAILTLLVSAIFLAGVAVGEAPCPPVKLASESEAASETSSTEADIVDTAIAAGSFTILIEAIQEAGLEETLKGTGPFTVFAPTDEAFAKIPEADLNALLSNKTQLASILTDHVLSEKIMSSDLSDGMSLETVSGQSVAISVGDDGVMVDNAKVVSPDILASNGVIHAIDTVIMPSA